MREKFKFLLFILLVFVCTPKSANAVLITPDPVVTGEVKIGWVDYEDKMGERPDSIDVEFYDMNNDKYVTKTLNVKDAKVDVSPDITLWTFDVVLPAKNDYIFYNLGSVPTVEGYTMDSMSSGGKIDIDGGSISLYFTKHFSKYVTYTEHWDDGNQRDMPRFFAMWMRPTNNDLLLGNGIGDFPMSLGCGRDKDAYIDDNTCRVSIYIPYAYPFDDNGVPIWDTPTTFEYEIYDTIKDYDYDYDVDDKGNIDVYITHEPYKLDNSKVEVIWDDDDNKNGKRPDKIALDLYNLDMKEQTIMVSNDTWNAIISNLYQNYSYMQKSEYHLSIENTDDYEFVVTGNDEDGFFVNAKYIGEEIKDNIVKEDNTLDKELNPKTNDNIIVYVIMSFLMVITIIISGCVLMNKNFKKVM